jgi:hypothetical protein
MLRVLTVPGILIALFLGAYLSTQQMRTDRPAAAPQQIAQAKSAGSGVDFNQVAPVLQAYFDEHQTYAGATLPPGSGVALVTADATSYCVQSGNAHEIGPGGTPQPGSC